MNSPEHLLKSELKGRNLTADFLKGTAVLFMIQVHITELLATPEFFSSDVGKVSLFLGGPPAAPVFMAVMGYFLSSSKKDWMKGVERGIKLFIGGILLNIALNATLIYKSVTGSIAVNPYHYVFGADILTLAGMSVLIISLLRYFAKDSVTITILFTIAVIVINHFLPLGIFSQSDFVRYLLAFIFTREYWSYFPLLPWLVYPLVGYLFGLMAKRIVVSERHLLVAAIIFIVFFILSIQFVYDLITILQIYYHHGTDLITWNIIFLAGYISFIYLLHKKSAGWLPVLWLQWIGKNVTAAYVIQWILLGNAGTLLYKSVAWYWLPLWFISILFLVSMGIYLWQRFSLSFLKGHKSS